MEYELWKNFDDNIIIAFAKTKSSKILLKFYVFIWGRAWVEAEAEEQTPHRAGIPGPREYDLSLRRTLNWLSHVDALKAVKYFCIKI